MQLKLPLSPLAFRVAPFVIFAGLTMFQGKLGPASAYWIYLLKVVIGGITIWLLRPMIAEMRWKLSWEGIVVGVLVFAIWVGLDPFYPKMGSTSTLWNPHDYFGSGTGWAWFFIVVRMLGVTFVVPPIEEVFYRSFLYRYVAKPDFEKLPLSFLGWTPFLVTAGIFGIAHPHEWLAGFLCGVAYQGLVIWKRRLGDAMTAHAVTNLLLGLWVNLGGMWHFW